MKAIGLCVLWCAVAGVSAFAAESISITATPRYPWNGKVDLKFTIDGTSGTKYDTSFTAKDVAGGTNLTMKTLYKSNGTAANAAKEQLLPGTYNWVWDATADLGEGTVLERVVVEGKTEEQHPLYMVIDLSSGSSSSKYPVSYLDAVPSGGWSDTYKTTKMVFRYIAPGSFVMGSPSSENGRKSDEGLHNVTLTKGYYLGVFEVTAMQYKLVMGSLTYRPYPDQSGYAWIGFNYGEGTSGWEKHPMEDLKYYKIRGKSKGFSQPITTAVDSDSLVGLLRTRTGLSSLDLPTEAQWEFACRAGTTTALYTGKDIPHSDYLTDSVLTDIAVYYGSSTAVVGSKKPNSLGLYDMYGNVWEWCLDWYSSSLSAGTDPLINSSAGKKVCRGGAYGSTKVSCRSACRYGLGSDSYRINENDYVKSNVGTVGARLCVTIK